jgi:beta-lactamase regulating signal transducer with metallopeptidase domain
MIAYLRAHLVLSILLFVILFFLSRSRSLSNRAQRIALYMLLAKAIFPWGLLESPAWPFFKTFAILPRGRTIALGGLASDAVLSPGGVSIETLAAILWFGVSAVLAISVLAGLAGLSRKIERTPASRNASLNATLDELGAVLNLRKRVSIKILGEDIPPFAWRGRLWCIALPESMLSNSELDARSILGHEMIHIARRDNLKFLALRLIRAVFFFSPFVHVCVREILAQEEIATDREAVARFGISPRIFAETLLNYSETGRTRGMASPALVGAPRKVLRVRIEELMIPREPRLRAACVVLVASLALCLTNFAPAMGRAFLLANPLATGRITMGYGIQRSPFTNGLFYHRGIDLAAPLGEGIQSSGGGFVKTVGMDPSRGRYVILDHGKGIQTLYAHLKDILVAEGQRVEGGERIATVGNTGVSTGPHLLFEVMRNGDFIDPRELVAFSPPQATAPK